MSWVGIHVKFISEVSWPGYETSEKIRFNTKYFSRFLFLALTSIIILCCICIDQLINYCSISESPSHRFSPPFSAPRWSKSKNSGRLQSAKLLHRRMEKEKGWIKVAPSSAFLTFFFLPCLLPSSTLSPGWSLVILRERVKLYIFDSKLVFDQNSERDMSQRWETGSFQTL